VCFKVFFLIFFLNGCSMCHPTISLNSEYTGMLNAINSVGLQCDVHY